MSRVKSDWSPLTMLTLMALAPAFRSTVTAPESTPVVGLEGVLEREGIDVDHDRRAAGLGDDARVVGDLVLLRRDEQHVHAALAVGAAGVEDLVVEVDVLDVERDVLLGFPVDRLGELRPVITGREIFLTMTALPDSDAATSVALKPLVVEQAADGVGDGDGIDDGAVDDGVGRHRLARRRPRP